MVICEDCKREMMKTDSCTFNRIVIDGEVYNRKLYDDSNSDFPLDRCPDCNVGSNKIHHYGCDNETCPSCKGQLISCGCNIESIISDESPMVINFTTDSPEEYLRLLREKGVIA